LSINAYVFHVVSFLQGFVMKGCVKAAFFSHACNVSHSSHPFDLKILIDMAKKVEGGTETEVSVI
jgi:hypothetical protein